MRRTHVWLFAFLSLSVACRVRSPENPSSHSLSSPESSEPEDPNIYKVPVGVSPVLGPSTALVTIVIFTDFQCPFCKLANEIVAELRKEYGSKIRFVFKHTPSPRHPRSEPASQLVVEARAELGDAGFWKAHDAIFASAPALSDADLDAIAASIGLSLSAVREAVASHKYSATIQEDLLLAEQLAVNATPTFFVNGRRLVGALPTEDFRPLIGRSMAEAQARVRAGVPADRVYEETIKNGLVAPKSLPDG